MFDELGSGDGSLVAISEGAEAAAPFHPDQKPLDAYCAALLDHIEFQQASSSAG
jgi:ethanolamine utilization protein EutN